MKNVKNEILALVDSLLPLAEKRLLESGRKVVPHLTAEDILQPFDYQELEADPDFRYEEGFLHGILSVRSAIAREFQLGEEKGKEDGCKIGEESDPVGRGEVT